MQKKLKWGIMGTGRIAHRFCDTLAALEEAEIYAVGSRDTKTGETFGAEYGIPKCYGSYQELVQDPQVELIYVATPIGSHYENVKLCLEAGKAVLCEKALTQDSAQARELQKLAEKRGIFLMEAMWSKCQPVYRKLMEWKETGAFGEIQGVESRFYTKATSEHRLIKDRNHGGALFDLTIYPLTYACSLLGYEPKEIHALAVKGGDDVDVMESIQLRYANGSFASLTGGLSCEKQVSLYIHGTKGRVLIEQDYFYQAQRVTLMDWENQPVEQLEAPFDVNGYEYEALEAMDCVRQGKTQSMLVPLNESIAVIELMEACVRQWDSPQIR